MENKKLKKSGFPFNEPIIRVAFFNIGVIKTSDKCKFDEGSAVNMYEKTIFCGFFIKNKDHFILSTKVELWDVTVSLNKEIAYRGTRYRKI